MKKLNILKTFAINIVVISLLCAFCFPINAVNALTNYTENKENRSIETLTITADQGLGGDMGYVTCKVIVNYNIQARTYKVASDTSLFKQSAIINHDRKSNNHTRQWRINYKWLCYSSL